MARARRRLLSLLLFAAVGVLGWYLFANVGPSRLFTLAAPPPEPTAAQRVQRHISATTLASLTTVGAATVLEAPRYTGQDNQGRQWEVTARSATQTGGATSGTYVLAGVAARWNDPSAATPYSLAAGQGEYTQGLQRLVLTEGVQAQGLGVSLSAPTLSTNLATRNVQAEGGVEVTGEAGGWHLRVRAPTLTGRQNNQQLTFTGGVRAILTPTKAP